MTQACLPGRQLSCRLALSGSVGAPIHVEEDFSSKSVKGSMDDVRFDVWELAGVAHFAIA